MADGLLMIVVMVMAVPVHSDCPTSSQQRRRLLITSSLNTARTADGKMCALRLAFRAQHSSAHHQTSLVGILIPLLIKYRHLPRQRADLRDAEPTYRTVYRTKGIRCEAKEGRGRIQKDG